MKKNDYLLFIDQRPIHHELKKYFDDLGLQTIQMGNVSFSSLAQMPKAILLDWHLIHQNLQIIEDLSAQYPTPLFVMHETFQEEICIQALEAGADAFIVKPLYPRELHARINAVTRRIDKNLLDKAVYQFDNWQLCAASRRVLKDQQEIALSSGEYDLLLLFVQNPQVALSRESLMRILNHIDMHPFDRRIDVQISRLRQKIETDAKKPVMIKTVRNRGYVFTPQVRVKP